MNSIEVAYCADAHVEIGLRASINSIIKNTTSSVRFHVITSSASPISFDFIENNVIDRDRCTLHRYFVDTNAFSGLRPLVGSRFPYAKLLIPEIILAPRVIYLDTDTIVDLDLIDLWQHEIGSARLAAVNTYATENSIERDFLISTGLGDDDPYFNTGVMIMNLDLLRAFDIKETSFKFANKFSPFLKTADQTVINALFSKEIAHLPERFNVHVRPNSKVENFLRGCSIFHFVGAPKPWDLLATKTLNGYPIFADYMIMEDRRVTVKFNLWSLFRPMRILRYYIRVTRKKL